MNVQNHCLLNLVEILYAGVTYHRPLIHRPVERQPKGVHPRNGAVGVNRVHVVSDVSGSVRVWTYSILNYSQYSKKTGSSDTSFMFDLPFGLPSRCHCTRGGGFPPSAVHVRVCTDPSSITVSGPFTVNRVGRTDKRTK